QSGYHNVPKVNGFDQQFGAKYRSADVQFDAAKHEFSLNIGNAYPSQAQIDHWTRSYRLEGNTLYINDRFTLGASIEPQEVHFLTWTNADKATPGEVLMVKYEKRMKLVYSSNRFKVKTEVVELTDCRLSNVWGSEIRRLILKEKK